jgi:hypothetical protein
MVAVSHTNASIRGFQNSMQKATVVSVCLRPSGRAHSRSWVRVASATSVPTQVCIMKWRLALGLCSGICCTRIRCCYRVIMR